MFAKSNPFPLFDNGVDHDVCMKAFIIIMEGNNILDDLYQKHNFGTTLRGIMIDWYVKLMRYEPTTPKECVPLIFCKRFRATKTDYEIITKLFNIKQAMNESIEIYYIQFWKM